MTPRLLGPDIWAVDAPLRLVGVELGSRTTIVRLPEGGLWLHSPVRLDEAAIAAVRDLGAVRAVVAPNRFHHMFVAGALRAFPEATLFIAPGLAKKRPDLAAAQRLAETSAETWSGVLEPLVFDAAPAAGEVVFHHRPSGTLILCDLCFNDPPGGSWLGRLALSMIGGRGGLKPSRTFRLALSDRRRARQLVDRILQWDFDRVTVTHGNVVESGGREAFRRAWDWL